MNINTKHQMSHDTMNRGPGTLFINSSVVFPCTIAARPSSTCTNTLMMHPMMMNQSSENP